MPLMSEQVLAGKVAVVTAASSGLGLACARVFAAAGAELAICSSNEQKISQAAEGITQSTGASVYSAVVDMTQAAPIEQFFGEVAERFKKVDVLCNSAGGPPAGDFESLDDEQWYFAFNLTVMNIVRAVRHALPLMRAAGGGRVINIASTSVKQPIPGLLLSNVMRPGIAGLVKTLSRELAADRILVNAIAPGGFDTPRSKSLTERAARAQGISPDQLRKQSDASIPLKRIGRPEELGALALYLASPASAYVTGQTILIDGGITQAL